MSDKIEVNVATILALKLAPREVLEYCVLTLSGALADASCGGRLPPPASLDEVAFSVLGVAGERLANHKSRENVSAAAQAAEDAIAKAKQGL